MFILTPGVVLVPWPWKKEDLCLLCHEEKYCDYKQDKSQSLTPGNAELVESLPHDIILRQQIPDGLCPGHEHLSGRGLSSPHLRRPSLSVYTLLLGLIAHLSVCLSVYLFIFLPIYLSIQSVNSERKGRQKREREKFVFGCQLTKTCSTNGGLVSFDKEKPRKQIRKSPHYQ